MESSIDPHEVLWLDESSTWMDPIRAYIIDGTLPQIQKKWIVKKGQISSSYMRGSYTRGPLPDLPYNV